MKYIENGMMKRLVFSLFALRESKGMVMMDIPYDNASFEVSKRNLMNIRDWINEYLEKECYNGSYE